jgi:hypothetical protein
MRTQGLSFLKASRRNDQKDAQRYLLRPLPERSNHSSAPASHPGRSESARLATRRVWKPGAAGPLGCPAQQPLLAVRRLRSPETVSFRDSGPASHPGRSESARLATRRVWKPGAAGAAGPLGCPATPIAGPCESSGLRSRQQPELSGVGKTSDALGLSPASLVPLLVPIPLPERAVIGCTG